MEVVAAEETHTILIRAYRKTQLPVRINPLPNEFGRHYTGQGESGYFESLTNEEKRDLNYIITPDTYVTLTDSKVIDLKNQIDKANWKWMQKHVYLAKNHEAGLGSRDAVFYVHDVVADATARVNKSGLRDEARYKVRQLSVEKQRTASKVLGLVSADSFNETQLLDWLLNTSDVSPEAVLAATDTSKAERNNAKIFFNEIVKYKVIVLEKTGVYRIGGSEGQPIGGSADAVLDYLLDPVNTPTVQSLRARLQEVKILGI